MQVSFQQRYLMLPCLPVGVRVVVSWISPVRKEYDDFVRVENSVEGRKIREGEEKRRKTKKRQQRKSNEEEEKNKEQDEEEKE